MNIRSLRLNFNSFLASIHNIINKINFIVLVETNITDNENNIFNINGFNSLFLNRDGRGGGIALYVRESLTYLQSNIKTISFESIQIDINTKSNNYSLICIYRPPKNNVKEFIIELDKLINNIKNKQDIIIIGDINIDILKQNITTNKYTEMLSSNGLQSLINESTREDINKKTSTCIDHLYTRSKNTTTQTHASIVRTSISDHYALFCCLQEVKEKQNKQSQGEETTQNQGTNLNNNKVNRCIKNYNWCSIYEHNLNTNNIFNKIYEKFNNIYENSKAQNTNKKKRKVNPWLNESLLKCCNIRDKLYNKWLNNKNNKQYESEYKKFRNMLNKKLNYAKNFFYKTKFIENRNNIRVTWQLINELTGKKTSNIDKTVIKNFNSENVLDIANKFADNFKNNVNKILHKCDINTLNYSKPRLPNSIYLCPTSEEEIFGILINIKERKGAGIDNIRPRDLKYNAAILAPLITAFVNSSINSATIPKLLKSSVIRPIYKSGTKNDCNNYRPIAILPAIEKILEEIIVRRLNEFLNKYKILNPCQFGFQKGKNINKLLGNFSNYINKCLSENTHCLALFIDFSKAFDTISHSKLLEIMERYGIRGNCLQWLKNYLELRSYRVKINNSLSNETFSENNGVPQGSKLGPILYLIYANEMINVLKNSTAFAYADDTAVIVSNKKIEEAENIMQNELNIITKWSHDNGLVINAAKTKLMHIKPRHLLNHKFNLVFHNNQCIHKTNLSNIDTCNTTIENVKTYKYLGVYVDENFKWLTHVQNLRKKLKKSAYSLFHLSNCTPFTVLKQAYFSLAESYLRHGITAWGSSTYCSSLQLTQNQILKILLKNKQHNQKIQYSMIYSETNNVHSNQNTNVNHTLINNALVNNICLNSTVANNTPVNNSLVDNNTLAINNTVVNSTHGHNDPHVNNNTYRNNTNVSNNENDNRNNTHVNNNPHVNNTHVTYAHVSNDQNVNDPQVNNNPHVNNNTIANNPHVNDNTIVNNTQNVNGNNTYNNNNTHVNTHVNSNQIENITHVGNNNTIVSNIRGYNNPNINNNTHGNNIQHVNGNNTHANGNIHTNNNYNLNNNPQIHNAYDNNNPLVINNTTVMSNHFYSNLHVNNNTHSNIPTDNNNTYVNYNQHVNHNQHVNNNIHVINNTHVGINVHRNNNTHVNNTLVGSNFNTMNVNNTRASNTTTVNNNTYVSNTITTSRNRRATTVRNIATELEVLNIRSLYNITLINEFYNDSRYLKPIDHTHNTRRKAEGRYKVERFHNNYGKNCLSVVLPALFNKLPTNLLNLPNTSKRKNLLKSYFFNSQ